MKFSIITINYNNRDGLKRTIESVIKQTFQGYEFIIIDGGSTDGSVEVIKQYESHITYWISEKDKGVYNAMNKGIRIAIGDYINFMNSGDVFYNSEVLSTVENIPGNYDIIVGRDYHYDEQSHKGYAPTVPLRISMITFFKETLPHQGAFISRKLFKNSMYDESLQIASDWAFYVKSIVEDGCSVKPISNIISWREEGGISSIQAKNQHEERNTILHQILPKGVYRDYETLAHLDKSTLYKLMNICEQKRPRKLLTLCIKIISRFILKS